MNEYKYEPELTAAIARHYTASYGDSAKRLAALDGLRDPKDGQIDYARALKLLPGKKHDRSDRSIRDTARGLMLALKSCAQPALDAAPDLDALAQRLNAALWLGYTLHEHAEPRHTNNLTWLRLVHAKLGLKLDDLPSWGDPPPTTAGAVSWDGNRVLVSNKDFDDALYIIHPRSDQ